MARPKAKDFRTFLQICISRATSRASSSLLSGVVLIFKGACGTGLASPLTRHMRLLPVCPLSAQNRNNSGKRISTTLHGSHCLDRCLLRLVLVNNRI
jgi:hypothetical protein